MTISNDTTKRPTTAEAADCKSGEKRTTKTDRLIQLLKARGGRDIATLSSELGWQHHTTRAALSRLRKTGYAIEKQAPGKRGGTRYRISKDPAGVAQ